MIVQGTNEPIVLEFPEDMTEVQDFSAVLLLKYSKAEQKSWRMDDIEINENVITLPITQDESLEFGHGNAILQIKWMINDSIFTDESEQYIKKWFDDNVLGES